MQGQARPETCQPFLGVASVDFKEKVIELKPADYGVIEHHSGQTTILDYLIDECELKAYHKGQ